LVKRDRRFIADILINGLHRLEYRGYDSSGIAFDGDAIEQSNDEKRACLVVRQKGKVAELEHAVKGKSVTRRVMDTDLFHFPSSIGEYRLGGRV
jgi:glucosamine 6-phosphate synthetase-like amidotransferase/phosphosugar isomerase protein